MKINTFLFVAIFGLAALLPSQSHAYLTTSQTATQYGDKVLFTITYKFGTKDYDLYMPIMAVRGLNIDNKTHNLGFTIIDSKKATTTQMGQTNALVLANAQIKGEQYFIPKGTSGEFTFVSILNAKDIAQNTKVVAQVTALPFTMVQPKVTINAHLNPTELQYYVTPIVSVK